MLHGPQDRQGVRRQQNGLIDAAADLDLGDTPLPEFGDGPVSLLPEPRGGVRVPAMLRLGSQLRHRSGRVDAAQPEEPGEFRCHTLRVYRSPHLWL